MFSDIVLSGGSTMFGGTFMPGLVLMPASHSTHAVLTSSHTRLWRPFAERGDEAGPAPDQDSDLGALGAHHFRLDGRLHPRIAREYSVACSCSEAPLFGPVLSWFGPLTCSLLLSAPSQATFSKMWVTKREWEASGPSAIYR